MQGTSERMAALFLLGALLLNPPLLDIFDVGPGTTVFGIPLLYFYIFTAWGILIALVGLVIRRHHGGMEPPDRTG